MKSLVSAGTLTMPKKGAKAGARLSPWEDMLASQRRKKALGKCRLEACG
jgi:hypothetical protein